MQASNPPVERPPHGCGGGNRTHLMAAYETAVCSSSSSPHQIWSTEQESNLRPSAYQADAQPTVLSVGGAPRNGWSRRADSNRHLSFTRARFFPLNYFDMERVTGFEPVSGPWHGPILAVRRYSPGASGENRTPLACLEGRNSTNKSHSREIHLPIFNCQRTHSDGSAWTVRSLQP